MPGRRQADVHARYPLEPCSQEEGGKLSSPSGSPACCSVSLSSARSTALPARPASADCVHSSFHSMHYLALMVTPRVCPPVVLLSAYHIELIEVVTHRRPSIPGVFHNRARLSQSSFQVVLSLHMRKMEYSCWVETSPVLLSDATLSSRRISNTRSRHGSGHNQTTHHSLEGKLTAFRQS